MRKCECGKVIIEQYRFTDWYNDDNDDYGSYAYCKKVYDKAVLENPTGRYSIYDVSGCDGCCANIDEGILFNDKCPEYAD